MSLALSSMRTNVIRKIRDVDRSTPAVKKYAIDMAISDSYHWAAMQLYPTAKWTTLSALAAGTRSYTLTAGSAVEFQIIEAFRLQETLRLVEKIEPARLAGYLQNNLNQRGEPFCLAVNESAPASPGTTETNFEVFPTPNQVYTLEALYMAVPGVLAADTDPVQLGQYGLRAVEFKAASDLLTGLIDSELARLQVNPRLAETYISNARESIDWELTRQSRLKTGRFANKSYTRP